MRGTAVLQDEAVSQLTVAFQNDLMPTSPIWGGTLEEILAGELAGGEGSPEWRDWVARAAARRGLTPAA